jgi:hypothetical protein
LSIRQNATARQRQGEAGSHEEFVQYGLLSKGMAKKCSAGSDAAFGWMRCAYPPDKVTTPIFCQEETTEQITNGASAGSG